MAQQNLVVATFVCGGTTFTASEANGVFVERGDAGGPRMVNRIVTLPSGAIHDMDGTDDATLTPGVFWQDIVFSALNPASHPQYATLLALVGRAGTLNCRLSGTYYYYYTAPARLLPLKGTWEMPYALGMPNWLTIRAEWQLKGFWS